MDQDEVVNAPRWAPDVPVGVGACPRVLGNRSASSELG